MRARPACSREATSAFDLFRSLLFIEVHGELLLFQAQDWKSAPEVETPGAYFKTLPSLPHTFSSLILPTADRDSIVNGHINKGS